MTDERIGEALWPALERLPRGSGVVFRHYGLPLAERRILFGKVAKVARRRNLDLVRAGGQRLGRGEAGVHNGRRSLHPGLRTTAVHKRSEAIRSGADMIFVSPVFATRSHPGARPLGRVRLGLMIRGLTIPVIALGGMNSRRAKGLPGIHGWAGIDAFS
jgi:thiamine-phosphate pyrophosphorylase